MLARLRTRFRRFARELYNALAIEDRLEIGDGANDSLLVLPADMVLEDRMRIAENLIDGLISKHLSQKGTWSWLMTYIRGSFERGTRRAIAELSKFRTGNRGLTSTSSLSSSLPSLPSEVAPVARSSFSAKQEDYWEDYFRIDPDAVGREPMPDPRNELIENLREFIRSQGPEAGAEALLTFLLSTKDMQDRWRFVSATMISRLRGLTEEMRADLLDMIREGMINGLNPREVAVEVVRQLGISVRRASAIARTEMMRAHNSALIAQYRAAGIEGVEILVEWLTAGDDRVCPVCESYGGKIFRIDDIDGKLPAHPNCRCVPVPVVVTPGKEEEMYEQVSVIG